MFLKKQQKCSTHQKDSQILLPEMKKFLQIKKNKHC